MLNKSSLVLKRGRYPTITSTDGKVFSRFNWTYRQDDLDLIRYIEQLAGKFEAADLFYGHGTDNAFDEAIYLVYGVLDIDYAEDPETVNRNLSSIEIDSLETKAKLRIEQRTPVAYLLNQAWFAGYKFYSDERALIPRSPIAELILNKFQPLLDYEPGRILDLCCGGGCIGIACAKQFVMAKVEIVDIDDSALALARENIELHACHSNVSAIKSDLFENLFGSYDLIVCNPPYVSKEEFEGLPQEFKAEPSLGLLSEEEGLEIPSKVLRQAGQFLTADGLLIMEVGLSADLLVERYRRVPFLWLEFAEGGQGVLALNKKQLERYSGEFN